MKWLKISNMLKYLKGKIVNFTAYMTGLDKQLTNAKNDAERNKILTLMVEAHKKQNEVLDDENKTLKEENTKLKEQVKEHEELESILSSGSNSSEGIDAKVEQEIKELERVLLTEKKSTAPIRKTIKLLKRIKKLKFLNFQKDQRIKELEKNKDLDLGELSSSVDRLTQTSLTTQEKLNQIKSQIEITK